MMAHIECWLGSVVIFQGIRTSIAKTEPYIFVIYQGGPDPLSPLRVRAWNSYFVIDLRCSYLAQLLLECGVVYKWFIHFNALR